MSNHVTDVNLEKLCKGQIQQDRVIDLLEHITSCADCNEKYLYTMEKYAALSPPAGIDYDIKTRCNSKKTFNISRFVVAGVGIAAAVTLWMSGAFSFLPSINQNLNNIANNFISEKREEKIKFEYAKIEKETKIMNDKLIREMEEHKNVSKQK